jgi:hypothetical protein
MEAVVENEVPEEIAGALAPAELLPPGIQQPVNIVDGRPELILPSDHMPFTECAEQCFRELANTKKFFRQGDLVVELVGSSNGPKLVELTPEAFRSRLESHFTLRSVVIVNGQQALRPKRCSQDNAKALLATEAALKHLPPIQAVANSPVFAEDQEGKLAVLSQGYHGQNGGTYILSERNIVQDIDIETAVRDLLGLLDDFSFASPADKSRFVAGMISPALRFGGLLKADFPLDLCEADQSQTGKGFRVNLISKMYDEIPFVLTLPSARGVGSVDESISAALLSGKGFIVLDNMRGQVNSPILESAIKGAGEKVMARKAYSKPTLISTNHVIWMGTSNRAEATEDLANRSIITRLRKRPLNYTFRKFDGLGVLDHVERKKDYYLSCIFAVVRNWFEKGKRSNPVPDHDFREWCGVMDWIVQTIFKLPALLENHREQQERISSPGLSFLREICNALSDAGLLEETLTTADIAAELEARQIDIPGKARASGDYNAGAAAVGRLLKPVFKHSEVRDIEEFRVHRKETREYNEKKQANVEVKLYWFSRIGSTVEPFSGDRNAETATDYKTGEPATRVDVEKAAQQAARKASEEIHKRFGNPPDPYRGPSSEEPDVSLVKGEEEST